jgi:hypothetical protein
VQFHGTWEDYTDAQRRQVLDKLADAGVGWIRLDIGWTSLQERGRSGYSDWYVELTDQVVDMARARGLKVLGTLWGTPGWANRGKGRNVPPRDLGDYAHAAQWAAEHFKGRVDAWEVWNEPNQDAFWTGSAGRYAALLKQSYPAFKAGDSSTKVVVGGPAYNDTNWISKLYDNGAKGSFDVMATHPYQGLASAPPELEDDGTIWNLSHVAAVHELMKDHGDGSKPIWFTEFGWSSHRNRSGLENWQRGVSPRKQGDYLVRTIDYVESDFPYVTNLFWYNERDRHTGELQLDNYGLLKRDLSPKPAYTRLKQRLTGIGL